MKFDLIISIALISTILVGTEAQTEIAVQLNETEFDDSDNETIRDNRAGPFPIKEVAEAYIDSKAPGPVKGLVIFTQNWKGVTVSGAICGLKPGLHGIHIHESGDILANCNGVGRHFNPDNTTHGMLKDRRRHAGDLGNLEVLPDGTSRLTAFSSRLSLTSGPKNILGRSIVIHEGEDNPMPGSGGRPVACGIIAIRTQPVRLPIQCPNRK